MIVEKTNPRWVSWRVLEMYSLLPLIYAAHLAGSELRPFLTEVSGLSAARVGQGNLDQLRASTVARLQAHSIEWGRAKGKENGWSAQDFEEFLAALPRTTGGVPGSYSGWVHGFQRPGELMLPHTLALALAFDQLLEDLMGCDDFTSFKARVAEIAEPGDTFASWQDLQDWEPDARHLKKLLDPKLLDVFASLDAEWGGQFFTRFQPVPLFLWVAPRVNERLEPDSPLTSGRNLVYRPVRRLLELSHALTHYVYLGHWPEGAVKRSELGRLVDLDGSIVGNYFDGTRRLSLRAYENLWERLSQEFARPTGRELARCPTALGAIAIAWQNTLVESSPDKSFKAALVLDEISYRKRWEHYRQTYGGDAKQGAEAWPAWLAEQSLWSNPLRVD